MNSRLDVASVDLSPLRTIEKYSLIQGTAQGPRCDRPPSKESLMVDQLYQRWGEMDYRNVRDWDRERGNFDMAFKMATGSIPASLWELFRDAALEKSFDALEFDPFGAKAATDRFWDEKRSEFMKSRFLDSTLLQDRDEAAAKEYLYQLDQPSIRLWTPEFDSQDELPKESVP